MPTATPAQVRLESIARPYVAHVGGEECVVRVTPLCPIADVLGFEHELAATAAATTGAPDARVRSVTGRPA